MDLTALFDTGLMAELRLHFDLRVFEHVAAYQHSCRLLLRDAQNTQGSEVQHYLLRMNDSEPSAQLVRDPITSGLLGLILDSQFRSLRPTVSFPLAHSMVKDWKAFIGTEISSFERCAEFLLDVDWSTTEIKASACTSVVVDAEVMAALGHAMMSRGSQSKAHAMLTQSIDEFRRQRKTNPGIEEPEFFYVTLLELIKCCNILGTPDIEELLQFKSPSKLLQCYRNIEEADWHMSQRRYESAEIQLLQCYRSVEETDWHIGQRIYESAEVQLQKISPHAQIPDSLEVIKTLRLNKVRRKSQSLDKFTLKYGGPMYQALKLVDHTNRDLSNACLDELLLTISFAFLSGFDVAADAKAVLAANTTKPVETWRLSTLETRCEGIRACVLGLQDEIPMTTDQEPGIDTLDDYDNILQDESQGLKSILGTALGPGVGKFH